MINSVLSFYFQLLNSNLTPTLSLLFISLLFLSGAKPEPFSEQIPEINTTSSIALVSPLELTINEPEDGIITTEGTIEVSGAVFPPARSTVVTVNGQEVDLEPQGTFTTTVGLKEGNNTITIIARNKPGDVTEVIRQVTLDTTPPEITISSSPNNSFTNQQQITLGGSVSETLSSFIIDDKNVELDQEGNFTADMSISEGENSFTIKAVDLAGNSTTEVWTVTGDFAPPELLLNIAFGDPADPETEIIEANDSDTLNTNLSEIYITGEAVDEISNVEGAVNQVPITDGQEDSVLTFSEPVELEEGLNAVEVLAYDQAGNISVVEVFIIRSRQFPFITIDSPADGFETFDASVQISGTVTDTTESISLRVNDEPVSVSQGGEFNHEVYLFPGNNYFSFQAVNAENAEAVQSLAVIRSYDATIPSDPEEVAPEIDQNVVTTMSGSTEFLYKGDNAIQRGLEEETIEPQRTSVVKGKIIDNSGTPLSGVLITILDHPEYGYTLSRDDGKFDMAVNGGGHLTVNYEKEDYLPVQRKVKTSWQDYAVIDSVMMIQLDANVTTINFSDSVEVARGSVESDADGDRQATLMFEQGTKAEMILPDGSTQSLNSLNVRATEYTVGENGPASMPAILPPTSGYTYAVELSVDEAIQAEASEVRFDKPVAYYVENFIGFPVGTPVPVGYYDRNRGEWIATKNGRIIEILSSSNELAELDVDGDGVADHADSLLTLGIDRNERQQLASLYQPGESLWRVELTHFSTVDLNWPYSQPADAERPDLEQRKNDLEENDKADKECGSIISIENQTLGEAVGLTGAPCGLHYNSGRTKGFKAGYRLPITLSGSTIPSSLKRIELEVKIAGTRFDTSFAPQPALSYDFQWDGKDVYDRFVQGAKVADVRVGYVYDMVYNIPADMENSFGNSGQQPVNGSRQGSETIMWQDWSATLGQLIEDDFGGWHPGIHHRYDIAGRMLYEGNGTVRKAENNRNIVRKLFDKDDFKELFESFSYYINDIDIGSDGSLYITGNDDDYKIFRQDIDGNIDLLYEFPYCNSKLNECGIIKKLAVTEDGSIYFINVRWNRIHKVNQYGEHEIVSGSTISGYSGDGGPAIDATLVQVHDIVIGPDGAIYIADQRGRVVRKIDTNGIINTIAGTGEKGVTGDEPKLASEANFMRIEGMDIGSDGSLYLADSEQGRIFKVTPDGIVTTVAGSEVFEWRTYGTEFFDDRGDGGPATSSILLNPRDVAVGDDGSLYIAEDYAHHIRKVTPDGIIYRLVGLYGENPYLYSPWRLSYRGGFNFNDGPGPATRLDNPKSIGIGPDNNIYFREGWVYGKIRMIESNFDYIESDKTIISSKDGNQLYIFDLHGKHEETLDALTSTTIYKFEYDSTGLLSKIIDKEGLETIIERETDGTPIAFIAPFSQRTEFTIGQDGYLSSVKNPNGEVYKFTYTNEGLLTQMGDPKNNLASYQYNSSGHLIRADYPNGGFKEFSKAITDDGFEVTMNTAEGAAETYKVVTTEDGNSIYTNTDNYGLKTTKAYGSDGTLKITSPDGTITEIEQIPDPRLGMQAPLTDTLRITTPSGLSSVFSQDRTITQYTGDEVTGITDSFIFNDKVTTSIFDGNQNLYTTTSPEGRQTFSYTDSLDKVIQTITPGIEPVNYKYNRDGFLIETEQGGRKAAFSYNDQGFLETITDPLERLETTYYDSVGRIITQVLPNGEEILYSYDANGNLSSITPPGKPAHTFEYTEVDLTDSYEPPAVPDSAGGIKYVYNKDKQLIRTILSDSSTIDIIPDTAGCNCNSGRPSEIVFDRGSIAFGYNDTTGQLASVVSPDSLASYFQYDGTLITKLATAGFVEGSVAYSYNNDFQVTSQTVNGEAPISFAYDDDGFITQAGALSLNYDALNGFLNSTSLGDITESYAYNAFGELTETATAYNASALFDRSYELDSLGRITSITETIEGGSTLYEYAYNDIGYLTEVREDGAVTSEYEYDANGNRTAYITPTDTLTATYDDQDRMLSYGDAAYFYGKRGDLQRKVEGTDTTYYNYDNIGNLRSVILPDGTNIEYLIDGQNRRAGKKVDGVVTKRWLYSDGVLPIAELDSAGEVTIQYGPGYIIKNDTTYKVITDQLGSLRMVVNSQTGEVAQRIDYDAWGNIIHLENPNEFTDFTFAGGLYDMHTGLLRFGARDYDAETGRWTAKDPILFDGGSSSLYKYAENDPLNNIDPLGLKPCGVGSNVLDYFQTGLDIAGLVPGIGELADGANALIYLAKGDYLNAGLSATAMVPFLGWGSTGVKLGNKAAKTSQGGLNLFKWGEATTTTANGWRTGDRMLYLPNKGTPKLNWKQNAGALRREMGSGNPIFDSYRHSNGQQIPAGGFLRAERHLLESRGWQYNPTTGAYHPPH